MFYLTTHSRVCHELKSKHYIDQELPKKIHVHFFLSGGGWGTYLKRTL